MKAQPNQNHQSRINSTQFSQNQNGSSRSWSTPSTPAHFELHPTLNNANSNTNLILSNILANNTNPYASQNRTFINHSLAASTASSILSLNNLNDFASLNNNNNIIQTSSNSNLRNLRNDLLLAADSVTNAMQNLVKELNTESDQETEEICFDNEQISLKQKKLNSNNNFSSYSATNTPLFSRKTIMNSSFTSLNNENLNLDDNHSLIYKNQSTSNSRLLLNKTSIIKQIAQTFKDMNNNSEYDDVVSELENELLNCQLEQQKDENEKTDDLDLYPASSNLDLNEEEEDDLIFESYLLNSGSNNLKLNEPYYNQNELVELESLSKALELNEKNENNEQIAMWRQELEQILVENENKSEKFASSNDQQQFQKTNQSENPLNDMKEERQIRAEKNEINSTTKSQFEEQEDDDEFSLL